MAQSVVNGIGVRNELGGPLGAPAVILQPLPPTHWTGWRRMRGPADVARCRAYPLLQKERTP